MGPPPQEEAIQEVDAGPHRAGPRITLHADLDSWPFFDWKGKASAFRASKWSSEGPEAQRIGPCSSQALDSSDLARLP